SGASVTGATESGNTVTLTTTAPTGLVVGQSVVVSGVGVAGYNGTFTVTSTPTPTSFTYTNPTAGLANSGGGSTGVGATESGTTVTISTGTTPHGFQVGQTVVLSGVGVGSVAVITATNGATEVGNTVTI